MVLKLSTLTLFTLFSHPSQAELPESIIRVMFQAQECQSIVQNDVYFSCMLEVNNRIKKSIQISKQRQLKGLNTKNGDRLSKNIKQKIQHNLKTCQFEQSRLIAIKSKKDDSEKRQAYCLYENMLELLINIERGMPIYSP